MDQHRRNSGKIYLETEKRLLIKRFIGLRAEITLSGLYEDPGLARNIPSKRTLDRIWTSGEDHQLRNSVAAKLENLIRLIENRHSDISVNPDLAAGFYTSLCKTLEITSEHNKKFIGKFAGPYKCFRITTNSREILVTRLEIRSRSGNVPEFTHIEVVPDEAKGISGRRSRIISHEGFVFAKNRRALFISPFKNIRQMSCIISSNQDHPTFTGILLTFDALRQHPFSARVFLTKTSATDTPIDNNPEYGLFPLDFEPYRGVVDYIQNAADKDGVLFSIAGV